jgi:ribosome recycling factor
MSEDIDIDAIEKRMNGAVSAMKSEFQALRTGRASASLLDKIMVNAYGAMTPLNQCA